MTTPHRTLQMALDALDAITDDVDGTGLNTMPSFDKAIDAITALREALAAPEPEPVALESVHLTRDTRGMCVVRVNGRVAIRDNGDIIDHMATLEWFAAPPAAPATAVPAEDFCYCNDEISLQMVSGGAAPEGLYGRLTLKIDGKYVEYVRAESAAPPAAPAVPLTDEQIDKILERERMKWATSPPTYEFAASFARAIEAAHGITGGKP